MYTALTVLIIIACILLILIVLVQNPKGGGLNQSFGFSNQTMGVQRTTDFLEKATWTLAICLLAFSLATAMFVPKNIATEKVKSEIEDQIENAQVPSTVPVDIPVQPAENPQQQP